MKVYVVEKLWAEDGEDSACYGSGVREVFANKADAITHMKELIKDENEAQDIFDDLGVRDGWEVSEGETSWSAWESGCYSQEHICIFVEEREVK